VTVLLERLGQFSRSVGDGVGHGIYGSFVAVGKVRGTVGACGGYCVRLGMRLSKAGLFRVLVSGGGGCNIISVDRVAIAIEKFDSRASVYCGVGGVGRSGFIARS